MARLDAFVELLLKWQQTTNLVAPSTLPHLWTRHIADSLQLLPLAESAKIWVDLGSGAGFPGLVIACALADRAGTIVHLIESNDKKAAFLREAIRVTGAPATVYAERIDDFVQQFKTDADVITARALAPLDRLLDYVAPLLKKGAKALLLKGQDIEAELTEASKCWNITYERVTSRTTREATILIIGGLRRRERAV